MKKIALLTLLSITSLSSFSQCSELFFSEYIEGSSSNKAFEIYNPTNSIVDLSNYVVYRNNNGSSTPTDSLFPQGILLPGEVYVTGNASANAAILAESDTTHTMTFYNGDDAVYLKNIITGDTLDIIGEIGLDPGSGWMVGTGATNNFTLIRQLNIQQGSTDWLVGATEWDIFPIDMTDSLGGHNMIACCQNTSSSITEVACFSYTSPSGNYTWTSSNTYADTITNLQGCDSIITVDLTINTIDNSVTQSNEILTAGEFGATYQWLNCPGMTEILEATSLSYAVTSNGDYAVAISKNGCLDTSACFTVSNLEIINNDFGSGILTYPNPTTGHFSIHLGATYNDIRISMTDLSGKLVFEKSFAEGSIINLNIEEAAGLYLLQIISDDKKAVIRVEKF
jgi:hypothetical protein